MRAALSLDLDNQWSYMKTHGDAGWEAYPSYLDVLVPRVLHVISGLNLRITVFVVGQDAALDKNRDALGQLARAGYEIANHSFHHEPWMHRRSEGEIDDELGRAEECIEKATGQKPKGFRGPGFVHSDALLRALARRRYLYDASSLPTFIGPFARAYYFRSAKLSERDMRDREDLFGSFGDGFQSNRRHRIPVDGTSLAELPVTTMPGLRIPIHISYVLYIATISPALALAYFRTALLLCKLTGTEPSILLHPLDFLTAGECPELSFFPAMTLDPEVKRRVLLASLEAIASRFDVVSMQEFAEM